MMAVECPPGAWFEQATLEILPELLGAARRLTRNREDAEDLVGDRGQGLAQHRQPP